MRHRFQECGVFTMLSHHFQMMILGNWRKILKKDSIILCLTCYEKQPLSFLQNGSPVSHNNHLKMMTFHSKNTNFGGLERPEISVLAAESPLLVA